MKPQQFEDANFDNMLSHRNRVAIFSFVLQLREFPGLIEMTQMLIFLAPQVLQPFILTVRVSWNSSNGKDPIQNLYFCRWKNIQDDVKRIRRRVRISYCRIDDVFECAWFCVGAKYRYGLANCLEGVLCYVGLKYNYCF